MMCSPKCRKCKCTSAKEYRTRECMEKVPIYMEQPQIESRSLKKGGKLSQADTSIPWESGVKCRICIDQQQFVREFAKKSATDPDRRCDHAAQDRNPLKSRRTPCISVEKPKMVKSVVFDVSFERNGKIDQNWNGIGQVALPCPAKGASEKGRGCGCDGRPLEKKRSGIVDKERLGK